MLSSTRTMGSWVRICVSVVRCRERPSDSAGFCSRSPTDYLQNQQFPDDCHGKQIIQTNMKGTRISLCILHSLCVISTLCVLYFFCSFVRCILFEGGVLLCVTCIFCVLSSIVVPVALVKTNLQFNEMIIVFFLSWLHFNYV
jgi:hypothetical protein